MVECDTTLGRARGGSCQHSPMRSDAISRAWISHVFQRMGARRRNGANFAQAKSRAPSRALLRGAVPTDFYLFLDNSAEYEMEGFRISSSLRRDMITAT